jgi:hypothetical protein
MARALFITSSYIKTSTKATFVEYPSTAPQRAVYENLDPRDTASWTSKMSPDSSSKEITTA